MGTSNNFGYKITAIHRLDLLQISIKPQIIQDLQPLKLIHLKMGTSLLSVLVALLCLGAATAQPFGDTQVHKHYELQYKATVTLKIVSVLSYIMPGEHEGGRSLFIIHHA
jgi:hypothetical protein